MRTLAFQWPWVLLNVSLYAFAIPWMLSAIINQYFISKEYGDTLPGLDDTTARIFFISAHMGLGLICLLLYPLQFFGCIRKRFPVFHRWSGRISLVAAVFASLCGIVFICLKKFHLVGGINMGIAFFVYGLVFGTCAVMTGYFARKREFRRHKNWAIRSYSQILATMLYRYYYAVLGGFGAVHSPDQSDGLYCDELDVCDYFLKPFDAIHAWTFFIVPLLFAEAVVYLLREQSKADTKNDKDVGATISVTQEGEKDEFSNETNENENNDAAAEVKASTTETTTMSLNFLYLNMFGILFAVICLGSTAFIYATSALGTNTFSV